MGMASVSRPSVPGNMPAGMLPPAAPAAGLMWHWLIGFVRPHGLAFTFVLVLSLAAAGASLMQPYLTQRLIDDGILKGQLSVVHNVVATIVSMALLSAFLGGVTRYIYVATSAKVLHALREALFAHLLTLSPSFFAATRQGDILQRLDGDIAEVQRFLVDALLSAVNNTVMLVGSMLMLAGMSRELTALMLLVLVLNGLFLRRLRPLLERLNRQARDGGADIAAFFVDILATSKCVQMFNGQDRENDRLAHLHGTLRERTLVLQIFSYLAGSVPSLVFSLGVALVFWVGSARVLDGQDMKLGVLIAFVTYMQKANGPMQSLLGLYVGYQRASVCLGRIQELTQRAPDVTPPLPLNSVKVKGRGAVEFKSVSFSYPNAPRPVFEHLSFCIPGGSRVAIRGASGLGKSTLADLLQRHFDPAEGSILIDGVDLRKQDLNGLRQAVVVVAQNAQLFSASLLENIRYGRPHASDQDVLGAARLAGLDTLIRQLPDGLQTTVGERGAALSGGQRQRVMLARALLMSPAIMVLDESTSGIDRALEAQIHHEIDTLFDGRTRIYISHHAVADERFDVVIDLNSHVMESQS